MQILASLSIIQANEKRKINVIDYLKRQKNQKNKKKKRKEKKP